MIEDQHGQQDTASDSTGVNMEDKLHFKQWRKVSTAGTSQLARQVYHSSPNIHYYSYRQGHAIAVVNNVAYLFGGTATDDANSTIFFNDLYSLQRTLLQSLIVINFLRQHHTAQILWVLNANCIK